MDELNELLSFRFAGTKKKRYPMDKWGSDDNCRPLKDSDTSANAILTGVRQLDSSGRYKLVAVDLDHKDNWDEVIAAYQALNLPQSLTVATPSGGYHIFFWVDKSIRAESINDDRHCKNFELKGDRNNITAPMSRFDCGSEYKIVRNKPIAKLLTAEAYRLCKRRYVPPRPMEWVDPDLQDVEAAAKAIDHRARRNNRGWEVHCPSGNHEDRSRSAILFHEGNIHCSACGYQKWLVNNQRKEK